MENNKQKFARVYAESFREAYPGVPIDRAAHLIEKAISCALENIRGVAIDGAAFKLTFKKLGIKPTYKAIEEFLNASA